MYLGKPSDSLPFAPSVCQMQDFKRPLIGMTGKVTISKEMSTHAKPDILIMSLLNRMQEEGRQICSRTLISAFGSFQSPPHLYLIERENNLISKAMVLYSVYSYQSLYQPV